ncbi:hypothetical protein SAMN05421854_1335 [Amycolatopsis rubida]|uniref:Uncharacterized protein n=1 Tax=Amycolatopsis rubida TaxID=112413 RepID=A0A1I6BMC3_9PSEU|nr:hypothetical protein SAMN05421854_1335 [Amycolatopsis rubida]
MLRDDVAAPRKQKHTIVRIYQRLITEHGFRVASLSTVRQFPAAEPATVRPRFLRAARPEPAPRP